ncbi:MAG: Bax inhibitor-1/YccA family protein [Candidatus Omnitrophica bacterium]|nr:Bax inhibitor-1/YccA family protein [Candidatus Omnitrophota bacterium]
MRSSNPTLNENVFEQVGSAAQGQTMTIQGAVNKTFVLLGLLLAAAGWIWFRVMQPTQIVGFEVETLARNNQQLVMPFVIGGMIGGIIFALITIKARSPKLTRPITMIFAIFLPCRFSV